MYECYNQIIIHLAIIVILFRISWTDLREHRIGKRETMILLGLGTCLQPSCYDGLIGGFVCGGIPEFINLILTNLHGLGGGDICLMFAAGWMLGTEKGLYALFIAGIFALLAAAVWRILGKRIEEGIPFGPFLSAGIGIMIIL